MSKRTMTALTSLIGLVVIVIVGVTAHPSGHDAGFWSFIPIYIAVTIATGGWSSSKECNLKFWHKKEQSKQ